MTVRHYSFVATVQVGYDMLPVTGGYPGSTQFAKRNNFTTEYIKVHVFKLWRMI